MPGGKQADAELWVVPSAALCCAAVASGKASLHCCPPLPGYPSGPAGEENTAFFVSILMAAE